MLDGVLDIPDMLAQMPDSQVRVSPKSGHNIVVMPHTLAAATRLRRLGFPAPSPMLTEYEWTGRYPPYLHQKDTSSFLTVYPRCIVLSDMATGKTASALWSADWLMKLGQVRKALVLAPLSCVNSVWMDELFKWTPHRSATLVRGGRDRRKRLARDSQADWMILNHDGLKVCAEELVHRDDIDLIILDEASVYRNADTARYRLLVHVVSVLRCRLWLLTGTPTPNAPTDAWALGRLINPEGTPSRFKNFRDQTMTKLSQFRWVALTNSKIVVRNILQPGIRYPKGVLKDIPDTTHIKRDCALHKDQFKHFEMVRKHLITEMLNAKGEGKTITAINAAGKINKLLQICQGSVYAEDGSIIDLPIGDRIDVTCELIDGSLSKSIVFIPYRHVCDRVQRELEHRGYNVGVVHGGIVGGRRDAVFDAFRNGNQMQVLVAHPRTAALGLNLQCASTTIWYGPTFSAEQWAQANERMARTGQKHKMIIARLSSMPVETGVYQTVAQNINRQDAILKLYEEVTK